MGSKNVNWLKISGVCGIIAPIVAFTFVLLAILNFPQFSWTGNALSDLGVQEGVTAILFNSGLVIGGILALVFASGLFVLQKTMLGRIGVFIFVLAALAFMAIGVFSENAEPTHYYVSVTFFVLFPISMLVIGATFLLTAKLKMGFFTFLAAIVAALLWAIHWTIGFGSNVAIPEALSALSALIWLMVLGFKMLREASQSHN
jgi:hypothetical membrane protein